MLNKFEETKRKQRFGLRKLKVGVASVLLGFTIFGFNLASQELLSVHADVVAKDAGSASVSDSSSSEVSEASAASESGTSKNVDQTATSDPTNTPGGVTGTTEETSSVTAGADAKATSKTDNTVAINATAMETKTDTSDLTPTEVPDENKTITVEDPMDKDLIDNGKDASWVSKNTTGVDSHVKRVYSIVQQIVSRRKDLYFFEGLVDYNEIHNHIIILLALDRNSALAGYSQNDVYGFIIHTGKIGETAIKENIESVLVTPGQTYKSYYKNTDNPVQITNYGENVGISLRDGKTDKEMTLVPGGDQIYGFVPAFDDGQNNTLNDSLGEWDDNHDALFGKGLYAV